MTELGVFGITVSYHPNEPALKPAPKCSCLGSPVQGHPELVSGSVPRTNNLDAQRRNEEPVFPKDGSMFLDEGPRTALCSVQRVFALKRTANLWIEMLKQVQHDGISDEELRT